MPELNSVLGPAFLSLQLNYFKIQEVYQLIADLLFTSLISIIYNASCHLAE